MTEVRQSLRYEARLVELVRAFFTARDVIEVSTPALSPAAATDPALASMSCEVGALGGRRYLQTSPEHAMKRLLAAGSGDIWQLARVFRDGELGRWHRPEFRLLEWYRVGFDERALMDEVFALLAMLGRAHDRPLKRREQSYGDAFADAFGVDPHRLDPAQSARLAEGIRAHGVDVPSGLAGEGLLDLALTAVIVPSWPSGAVSLLYDYPAAQAALARLKPGEPPVAARFEVFIDGVEIGNGYAELTDAAEQGRRFQADLARRRDAGLPAVPIDERLLAALAAGLPACAGVALGFERLLAVLAGRDRLGAGLD